MAAILATQTMLDEARLAYHQLQMGTQASVIVDMNGERVEFTKANLSKLYGYMQVLANQLTPPSFPNNCGPAGFLF